MTSRKQSIALVPRMTIAFEFDPDALYVTGGKERSRSVKLANASGLPVSSVKFVRELNMRASNMGIWILRNNEIFLTETTVTKAAVRLDFES